jgi:hypothetical protein
LLKKDSRAFRIILGAKSCHLLSYVTMHVYLCLFVCVFCA